MSALVELESSLVEPGGSVAGAVHLAPAPGDEKRAVELSVLWETSGKGDTDQGVVLHQVLVDGDPDRARADHRFRAALPLLPLTYDGNLIKIRWLVRVRRRTALGPDEIFDTEFVVRWTE